MEEKKFIRFSSIEWGGSCLMPFEDTTWLYHELEEAKPGEKYTVEVVMMTQEEFDSLPEFDGF